MTTPGMRALRAGRRSIPGHYYHITLVTRRRYPFFDDFCTACKACRTFSIPTLATQCETLSFVVMPDHVHWLLQLKGNLAHAVRLYKSHVSMSVGLRVWNAGYYDHALRTDEDIRTVARYIVANPLRAGLVDNIGNYPYWDAIWLER